ncbi:hypothetical protein SAMN05192555_106249 [Franzmannia pantelleriensis]|uniref:DUF1853 domain-containing protein n=1 Tax=Franzmannia pantelleriensis TaxID=48727 RepID=A0A1G9MKE4_9GAMM|nr:DUF1853 family protein [Halomonas pantelleriensis]SDL74377.1 hypothetical protein SAMN05192555_106249 [Halomonas pantelleriensis]
MCQTDDQRRIERYIHPLVRDLAWLIDAPDLLAMPWPGRPSREELGLAGSALIDYLDAQHRAPQALEQRIGDSVNGRLGHYHERLWQHLLDTAPGTRLIAHNCRIERDKRTLGELDLIYQRRDDGRLVHLEVAIKFYLGLASGPGDADSQTRWIGPGCVDSLAVKREHLHYHQLPLLDRISDAATLTQLLGSTTLAEDALARGIDQRLAIPGALFYPLIAAPAVDAAALVAPREATADHLRGRWLHYRQWAEYKRSLDGDTRGAWLSKPHWMAPPHDDQLLPLAALDHHIQRHFADYASPLPVMLQTPSGWQRLFIVGDDWPRRIPLPPSTPLATQ